MPRSSGRSRKPRWSVGAGQIRSEVAGLTVEATERVVGKVLDSADQRRLVEEAVQGLDFSALEKGSAN